IIDLTRRRFGRWMVLALHLERDQYGHVLWSCRCDCGTERIVRGDTLRGGISTSCGCFLPEAAKKHRTTHGMFGTRVYKIWHGMLQRCTNPNNSGYANYGGRGITVCEEWLSFENFYADVGDPPPGLSLDRTNNNGNYEPTNWGWATPLMQTRNRRPRSKTKIKTLPVKPADDDPVSNIPF